MIDYLTRLGWTAFFQNQLHPHERVSHYPARVAQIHRTHAVLWSAHDPRDCPISLFPDPKNIGVGDWVLLPEQGVRPLRVLERQHTLWRKAAGEKVAQQLIAANMDALFIVSSCNQDFNESRVERYLAWAIETEITPLLILTKADQVDDLTPFKQAAQRLYRDLSIICLDAREATQVAILKDWCKPGETAVLVGSSGAGKSTLINSLTGATQKTGAVRVGDDKGKHTTTARSLHLLQDGGVLIDTPGVRELQLTACEAGIEDTFEDVTAFFGGCKFNDCQHQAVDLDCAIQQAIAAGQLEPRRWQNYQKLCGEQTQQQQRLAVQHDPSRKSKQTPAKQQPRPRRKT